MARFFLPTRVAGLAIALALVLTGCGVTQQQPPTEYYTISSDDAAEFSLAQPVRIARVRVPDYVDNDRLWVRTQAQQLSHIRGARWAEAIGVAITRELSSSLGIGLTENPAWPLLLVNIDRIEAQWSDTEDSVVLVARWALESSDDTNSLSGQIRLRQSVDNRSASAVARATANLVTEMNQRIGEELIAHWAS